jgi:hypothetical protein
MARRSLLWGMAGKIGAGGLVSTVERIVGGRSG